jgi:predicted permease
MNALANVRLAIWALVRSPLFSVTAIASLAIGIAASSTIFSLADALFLRARPGLVNEARLVDIGRATSGQGFDNFGYQALLALRPASQLAGVAGFRLDAHAVSLDNGRGGSERAYATPVTANYFDVLGTRAAAGRFFLGDEDRVPDSAPVAIISHAFWVRRFGGSPDVVGAALRVNGRPYTVIGVTEPGFQGTSIIGTDMWVPFSMAPHLSGRATAEMLTAHGTVWHLGIARLKDGVSIEQARDELNGLLAPLKEAHPEAYGRWSMALLPSARLPGEFRTPVTAFVGVLFALTFMVLAIACSNVAGMLLARAMTRRREMATRLAVGAGRGQLVGQLLTETSVLFAIAAVASLALSWWMVALLESFTPTLPMPITIDLVVDARVLGFALGLALLTALTFGLAPALRATRLDIVTALHGQHSTPDRRGMRLRHVLVGAQVALALVLLVTTGLLLRALQGAASADTGYDGARVRVFTLDTTLAGRRGQQAVTLADRLLERLGAIGGVEAVATSRMIPLQGGRFGLGGLRVPGYSSPRGDERFDADWDVVSPTYFETLGVPLVEGRVFTSADREERPFVAVVNEAFAARAWPGRDAVGQIIQQETDRNVYDRPLTIVGVVRNANYRSAGEAPVPFIYVPLAQQPMTEMNIYVRSAPGREVAEDVTRAIVDEDPNLPLITSQTFEEATGIGLIPQRVAAAIAGGVGGVGLLLSALGLYGLMAFHAVQRTREVAVRMALGATSGQVRGLLLRQAATVGLAGGGVGLCLAVAAAMGVRGLLVGVQPLDGVAFGAAAAVLGSVLVAALWLPARRAATTDPARALRGE